MRDPRALGSGPGRTAGTFAARWRVQVPSGPKLRCQTVPGGTGMPSAPGRFIGAPHPPFAARVALNVRLLMFLCTMHGALKSFAMGSRFGMDTSSGSTPLSSAQSGVQGAPGRLALRMSWVHSPCWNAERTSTNSFPASHAARIAAPLSISPAASPKRLQPQPRLRGSR